MTALEQEQAQAREAWEGIAAGYDDFVTSTHLWVGNEAAVRAGLGPGQRFLDVAAGSGALSIPAARLGASVVATDISPTMLERLAARAAAEGLADVETQVMDGHELRFADDSFDVAGSQFGVMLLPDLPRAMRELARVTRPGGRVLFVVLGPPTQIEFITFFLGAIQAVVPGFEGLPSDPPPLPFQVAEVEQQRAALEAAGLRDVQIEEVTERLPFDSGQEMWSWLVNSNPVAGHLIEDLSEEQRAQVRRELDGMLRRRAGGSETAVLTNAIHIGIGTVPGGEASLVAANRAGIAR
jgi:ubiquinone/menaquinone biosynthesis C-methylase UbiE